MESVTLESVPKQEGRQSGDRQRAHFTWQSAPPPPPTALVLHWWMSIAALKRNDPITFRQSSGPNHRQTDRQTDRQRLVEGSVRSSSSCSCTKLFLFVAACLIYLSDLTDWPTSTDLLNNDKLRRLTDALRTITLGFTLQLRQKPVNFLFFFFFTGQSVLILPCISSVLDLKHKDWRERNEEQTPDKKKSKRKEKTYHTNKKDRETNRWEKTIQLWREREREREKKQNLQKNDTTCFLTTNTDIEPQPLGGPVWTGRKPDEPVRMFYIADVDRHPWNPNVHQTFWSLAKLGSYGCYSHPCLWVTVQVPDLHIRVSRSFHNASHSRGPSPTSVGDPSLHSYVLVFVYSIHSSIHPSIHHTHPLRLHGCTIRQSSSTSLGVRQRGGRREFLAHGDGDIDAQVAVLSEQLCDGRVEHQAVAVHDGRRDALVDGAWRGLPGQAAPVPVELQPVGKVLGLFASTDELHNGEELLVAVILLLLLQHQHEMEAEARLHHDPVHGARKVDVRGQEHNVLPLHRHTGQVP
ncbi:hypothetical protein INR49_012432 [Caranx melampygus]|nr:hypothetical protein INR49_012432 [Caranx melampygus]